MAKKGMRRYLPGDIHGGRNHHTHEPDNDIPPVPEIKGKAKKGKQKAGTLQEDDGRNVQD